MYSDPFNFFPFDSEEKQPTHSVNYFFEHGGDVSSPAIFADDADAIRTARNEGRQYWAGFSVIGIQVSKYGPANNDGFCKLTPIYSEGRTY